MILGLPVNDHWLARLAQDKVREHILMRDVFHCRPHELAEIDQTDVLVHWEIREAIRKEEEREAKRKHKRYNT